MSLGDTASAKQGSAVPADFKYHMRIKSITVVNATNEAKKLSGLLNSKSPVKIADVEGSLGKVKEYREKLTSLNKETLPYIDDAKVDKAHADADAIDQVLMDVLHAGKVYIPEDRKCKIMSQRSTIIPQTCSGKSSVPRQAPAF